MSPLFNPKLLIFTILWLTPEKPDCDIFLFLASVEKFFLCAERGYDEQREFFILHCINHPRVFCSMFQWKSNMDHSKAVIERLNILKEPQKKFKRKNL